MTMRRLIRVGEPAVAALRSYPGSAILLVGMTAAALAALLSGTALIRAGSLLHTRLELSAPGNVIPPVWGPTAHTPAATQNAAIGALFQLLLCGIGAAGVVTVVALASLLAARESQRTVEMSSRRAVGASRRVLFGSALLEACILASAALVLGGAAGAFVSARALATWPGRLADGSLAPSIVATGVLVTLFLFCAALPLVFTRDSRAMTATSRPVPVRLAAFQLALSLIVLTAGGLLTHQVSVRLATLPASSARGEVFRQVADDSAPAALATRYTRLLDELDAGKRFDTVSLTATGGLLGLGTVAAVTTDCGQCSEGGIFLPWHVVTATHQFVSADTFHALGVRLLAGRGISRSDRWGATPVAVVSRSLAIRHFQKGEAIGRKMLLGDDPRTWHTVVGIVADAPARGLGGSLQPAFTVYASILQHPMPGVDLLIRPRPSVSIDATAVGAIDRALVLAHASRSRLTESELAADELRPLRWFAGRIALVGWVTLTLACVGTFALIRVWVISLLSELGLRRAVGARKWEVIRFVLVRAAGIGIGGVAAGLWFGPGVWNLLHSVMTDFPAWDGETVGRYALILLSAVILGAVPPAWQAARTPPSRLFTCS
jgi:putative ABC transport system permease protein